MRARVLVALSALVLAAGCAGPIRGLYPPRPGEAAVSVYVLSHGWHTGIAVRRADVPPGLWPEHGDFAGSEFVEVGWGDRDFYQAQEGTSGLALRAAVWSRASVLHVVGFNGAVGRAFPGSDVVELGVSARGLERLSAFIEDAYARDAAGRAMPLGPGQAPVSRFYVARETYYLWRTCNTWTARVLRAAGVPITPLYAITAGNVMYQVRRSGGATDAE
ncbi:MAG: DUF2459 domain-containing protein [Candidatus Rokubacteria bacterium]|nr:DUF2459 domain-containing protein [Candidatus Rokubacteria bacterium]